MVLIYDWKKKTLHSLGHLITDTNKSELIDDEM